MKIQPEEFNAKTQSPEGAKIEDNFFSLRLCPFVPWR